MRVGHLIAIWAREVMSHGSTPTVAKVELSSLSVEARMEGRAEEPSCSIIVVVGTSFFSCGRRALILDPVSYVGCSLDFASDASSRFCWCTCPSLSLSENSPCCGDTLRLFRAGSCILCRIVNIWQMSRRIEEKYRGIEKKWGGSNSWLETFEISGGRKSPDCLFQHKR